MSASGAARTASEPTRPWVLVAAYDVSDGRTSEGYVALNLLRRLSSQYRIVLVTRANNRDALRADATMHEALRGVVVLGFDLPRWAMWWKRGKRFYGVYAYLWQLCWPLALRRAQRLCANVRVCHVLNFHNDSIPPSAWALGIPLVWGPINHNELAAPWRRAFWPRRVRWKASLEFALRRAAWRFDPSLAAATRKARVIFSAGRWVERRLRVGGSASVRRLTQLGVDERVFRPLRDGVGALACNGADRLIVHAGRCDWIKGIEVAIEALAVLPPSYRLLLLGSGPAERRLRALAEELGVAARIRFEPPVRRERLIEIYEGATLFLFPSTEAGGLAWVEALACGLPVVGVEGETPLAEAARTVKGVHVSPAGADRVATARRLAETIERVAGAPRDQRAIRASVLATYSWDAVARKVAQAYEACRRRGGA